MYKLQSLIYQTTSHRNRRQGHTSKSQHTPSPIQINRQHRRSRSRNRHKVQLRRDSDQAQRIMVIRDEVQAIGRLLHKARRVNQVLLRDQGVDGLSDVGLNGVGDDGDDAVGVGDGF